MPIPVGSDVSAASNEFVTVILKNGVTNPQIASALDNCGYTAYAAFSTSDVNFYGLAERIDATTLKIRKDLVPKISHLLAK